MQAIWIVLVMLYWFGVSMVSRNGVKITEPCVATKMGAFIKMGISCVCSEQIQQYVFFLFRRLESTLGWLVVDF